jgi:hypothetical protein
MAGLRKVDVRDDLLRKLGIESAGSASASVLADVLAAMNYAQQTLWMAGPDYFTRSQISLALTDGVSAYTLADTVQSVLGPLRLPSGRTLRALGSRSEFDNFGMLYLGQLSPAVDAGTPLAYFVESLNQAGPEPGKIKIHVIPKPSGASAGSAVLDGVVECTSYVSTDLTSTDVLPIAQQYTESLFLPLARKAIMRSTYFSAKDLAQQIEADFEEALAMLRKAGGYAGPEGKAKKEVES